MGFWSAAWTGIKSLGKVMVKNPDKTIGIVTTVAGGSMAAVGAGNAIAANSTNKKATAIYNAAIKKNERSEAEVSVVLDGLAEKQLNAAALFADFANTIEKIQNRPTNLFAEGEYIVLPKYNPDELKVLSGNARLVLDAIGGMAVGTLSGAAFLGIQTAAFGFSAFGAGLVLCVKGSSLRKKAEENYQRAEAIKQEVDSITAFHNLLMEAAGKVAQSMDKILPQYEYHLQTLKNIVDRSDDWSEYAEIDELIIKNGILLTRCLNGLCRIKLTRKNENDKDIVNSEEILLLQEESSQILSLIDSYKFGIDNKVAMINE